MNSIREQIVDNQIKTNSFKVFIIRPEINSSFSFKTIFSILFYIIK
ncbi:hypothetical protein [Mycoplasmopsis cynos]|nr:hypothetical protein [Mycoplasmopsis cynos]